MAGGDEYGVLHNGANRERHSLDLLWRRDLAAVDVVFQPGPRLVVKLKRQSDARIVTVVIPKPGRIFRHLRPLRRVLVSTSADVASARSTGSTE
ncbi:hypothetical protein ACHAXT_006456 [Thalassiosira profunda]